MEQSVIISAAGVGKRMGTEVPKQFLLLKGTPIIFHTIRQFLNYNSNAEVIVVLHEDFLDQWEMLCKRHRFAAEVKVAVGGKERFHSIKNGLRLATGKLIAVHDAVRPAVSVNVIAASFESALKHGSGVPVLEVTESLRKISGSNSSATNRADFRLVQTPQCFEASILRKAYEQHYSALFTDDASVVEASGHPIHLVWGNRENIKITTPIDLKIAELFLNQQDQ